MDISVGKERKTGDPKMLSISAPIPEELNQRGVKVYDEGQRVVYEVRPGGSAMLENGVHPWSSAQTDELPQRAGQPKGDRAGVTVTRARPLAGMPLALAHPGDGMPPVLEFDGTARGDAVLIDEDDDRSLREKTVTDVSVADGNAADLVAGRPLSVSSELPSEEEKEESLVAELPPPPVTQKKRRCRCQCCTVM